MSEMSKQSRSSQRKQATLADIGEIPPVKNRDRREAYSRDLFSWLNGGNHGCYFPNSTGIGPFSADHIEVIRIIQGCILDGGWFVNAVFREFAKSTIAERAALWAVVYGHRKYCPIIGADEAAVKENLDSIMMELTTNDELAADFPEVCIPFRRLEGKHQRCGSQTHSVFDTCPDCRGAGFFIGGGYAGDCGACEGAGKRKVSRLTYINCVGSEIVIPSIRLLNDMSERLGIPVRDDGFAVASGGVISAHGILSVKRGMKRAQADGAQQRPDFCIVDDFQTDESANSEADIVKRLKKITKAIIPSAGQKRTMAIVVNGTVIEPNDGMERLLNPKISKAWQGRRIPILKKRASESAEKLWFGAYQDLLLGFDREAADSKADQERAQRDATEFYRQNRSAMDEGAAATWDATRLPWELSAVQHCYNIWIMHGEEVFLCEGQQQPKIEEGDRRHLTAQQISMKANGMPRGVVPAWARKLTFHIDVQNTCLYWSVLACGDAFTSHVPDYGVYPKQPSGTFSLNRIKSGSHTLQHKFPGMGIEGAIRAGIDALARELFDRMWEVEGGRTHRIDWGLIDSADESSTVYEAVRRSPWAAIFRAARGWKFGAADPSWEEFVAKHKRPNEEFGWHWWDGPIEAGIRLTKMDSNHWKSFVFKRLATAFGDLGCLSLFGSPSDHAGLIDHLLAPNSQMIKSEKGREVEEWKTPKGADDHLFDSLYGAFAAAARVGIGLPTIGGSSQRRDYIRKSPKSPSLMMPDGRPFFISAR